MPVSQAQAALQERLDLGEALAARNVVDKSGYQAWSGEISTWHDYNRTWIARYVGDSVAEEYAHVGPMAYSLAQTTVAQDHQDRLGDLRSSLRRLGSIRDRLSLWADEQVESDAAPEVDPMGPIFVVHGHDESALNIAVRVLERATDREVIVLREQPNSGRTLIEKFEHHAASAAFAVVLVTGDDVGGPQGVVPGELHGRARQNVVFELGFFFGKLGRGRVVVLLEPGVERPSDIDGLVYYAIDPAGAWKMSLAKELAAAGVAVNYSRIP